jgi:hypothetical protein
MCALRTPYGKHRRLDHVRGRFISDDFAKVEQWRQQLYDICDGRYSRRRLRSYPSCEPRHRSRRHRQWRRLHLFQSGNRVRIFRLAKFTYNFKNPDTQYPSGVDFHFDWGASKFLSKQVFIGLVGYAYQQVTDDSGQNPILGGFQSRVLGIGPQVGYIFPVGNMQGYLNLKAYGEIRCG